MILPLNDLDDLPPTQAFPGPVTILEAPDFFETGASPSLSANHHLSLVAGILTKALLTMEQISETGEHMALDQVVRKLVDELLPIL